MALQSLGVPWEYVLTCSGCVRVLFASFAARNASKSADFAGRPYVAKVRVGRSIRLARSNFPSCRSRVYCGAWRRNALRHAWNVLARRA